MAKPKKALFNSEQLILGCSSEGWSVLGKVDPFLFLTPKLLFRKILKPRAAHDYRFYYQCVTVVQPWLRANPDARLGARGWRIQDGRVLASYEAGDVVEKSNKKVTVYYEVSVLFQTSLGEDDVEN